MSNSSEIASYFDRHAPRYEELIETLAFQLNDAYRYLAEYVTQAHSSKDRLRVLELGIGTGILTKHLLEMSQAGVTGIDASAQMLKRAAQNLHEHEQRIALICGEFPGAIPDAEYDCVVSAISLSFYSIDYTALFRKVHRVLASGGLFVYAVNVAQNASSVDEVLANILRNKMKLTEEQIYWLKGIRGTMKLYQVPVDWHLAQLRQGGFTDIDCIYLRHKLGVFSGAKPRVAV
jgi:tRNA (cmo5U34)-methyltransferase